MSDVLRALQRKIKTAHVLQSIIKTIKIMAAINIIIYEKAVKALENYHRSVELGLIALLLEAPYLLEAVGDGKKSSRKRVGVVVFGSDQGMVGSFNDQIADYVLSQLESQEGEKVVWAIGERVHTRLSTIPSLATRSPVTLPNAIANISNLISLVLENIYNERNTAGLDEVVVFYNKPRARASFEPFRVPLLPIDKQWLERFAHQKWPVKEVPQVVDGVEVTFHCLVREHLFTSLFKACAESIASENAVRLTAMQIAEKNIQELLEGLQKSYNLERQTTIDEELFDVIAGFEVLTARKTN